MNNKSKLIGAAAVIAAISMSFALPACAKKDDYLYTDSVFTEVWTDTE